MCRAARMPLLVCLAVALVAATPSPPKATTVRAESPLVVYTQLTKADGNLIQRLAQQWTKKYGHSVKIIVDQGGARFNAAVAAGSSPDIMFGVSDDNLGSYQQAGQLAVVPKGIWSPELFWSGALPAVSFTGQSFAVPLTLDTVALSYNKGLVGSTVPKTFDDVTSGGSCGKATIDGLTTFANAYGVISALGGYVFRQTDVGFDTTDIGLGNAGTVKALSLLRTLASCGVIRQGITYADAVKQFQSQNSQVGMIVDGDWNIHTYQAALGSKYGTASLPDLPASYGGGVQRPFVWVNVAFVSASSRRQPLAWNLVKYLLGTFPRQDVKVAGSIPASTADMQRLASDPTYGPFVRSVMLGQPVPNVGMQSVWRPADSAIASVIARTLDPQAAANTMVAQISSSTGQ